VVRWYCGAKALWFHFALASHSSAAWIRIALMLVSSLKAISRRVRCRVFGRRMFSAARRGSKTRRHRADRRHRCHPRPKARSHLFRTHAVALSIASATAFTSLSASEPGAKAPTVSPVLNARTKADRYASAGPTGSPSLPSSSTISRPGSG
jgi:hypothetical protein